MKNKPLALLVGLGCILSVCVFLFFAAGMFLVYLFFSTGPGPDPALFQTCLSAPNSIGCEACLNGGVDGSVSEYDGGNPFLPSTKDGPSDSQICTFCEAEYLNADTIGDVYSACRE